MVKIVEQTAAIITPVNQESAMLELTKIELAGRLCYKSEDKITSDSYKHFIRKIIANGHHSVIEHGVVTIKFCTSRGVANEFVRHRIASYSQSSTRYCCYAKEKFGGELTVIKPLNLGSSESDWLRTMESIQTEYNSMIRNGIETQIARAILPICLQTDMMVTTNLREWRHIFSLRGSKAAHPEFRALIALILPTMKCWFEPVFDDVDVYGGTTKEKNDGIQIN